MDRTAYDRFFELEERHFWRIAKRRLVLEWLARYRPGRENLRILDVGGACSLITRELGRFGTVECIEADAATVEFARERLGANIRQGSFPDVAIEGRFDVITMLDVLEHIRDDLAALRAARRLLREPGLLLVTVPALPQLWSDHDVALHHQRRYLKRGLGVILEKAGFRVERCSYYTSLLLPFLALQRLAGKLKNRLRLCPAFDTRFGKSRDSPSPPSAGGRRRGQSRISDSVDRQSKTVSAPARARHSTIDNRRSSSAPTYDVRVPFAPLNLAFGAAMWKERLLLRLTDLPVGSSLIAACRAGSQSA
jgi:SAM-dependent methyltransferase